VHVIDKRFWARPEGELPEGAETVDLDLKPSYVRELEQKMALMEQKFREKTAWFEEETQRIQERLGREMGRRLEEEKGRLALDLLEVLDNLETAVEAFRQQATMDQLRQGVELVRDGFQRKMERLGLQPVGQAGEPFDPRIHEASCRAVGKRIRMAESGGLAKGIHLPGSPGPAGPRQRRQVRGAPAAGGGG
jgi:molecular chaperone GrpE (heat shock protein)